MKKNNLTIAIAGCGWIGKALGASLAKSGHIVKGSTRSESNIHSLSDYGINGYILDLPEVENTDFLTGNDFLIISIPAGTKSGNGDNYIRSVEYLTKNIRPRSPKLKSIILLSSIGIYPDENGIWTEDSKFKSESNKQIILETAESIVSNDNSSNLILRLGGLMGYDRFPAKYYVKRESLNIDHSPVNYIHRDDVVNIISLAITKDHSGIYNAVSPQHPERIEVLKSSARDNNITLPPFNGEEISEHRKVSGNKLITEWGYKFMYPDPVEFWKN
ncbi:NAD(P)-binding domain-containing protein [Marinigracilibium pacificum]|uniref:Pyrroline-5-carboxylate reductase catalytic N-terminal domain-containing protein n=1 Tax=Marinigracilibium pacificum TaxID=2729599 RepID=A0A848J7C7_9BACT|nr:NAD(P)-binding domain-containing protein [Marinigracilibium pacificum]NMM50299.1 hypothetical protein [Marinigracilibium pacificum]